MKDIEFLRGLRFTWTKIAEILGISRSTLYRRLDQEGISRSCTFTDISDRDLDHTIESIKSTHPNDGERLLIGHLHDRGIMLPRARVRASIHRVDPINTAIRRSIAIRRRVYCVDGPNALWHIDTHHKLIRWRLVIHGGVDGYSRTIVFLHCATNNQASTMMSCYLDAVSNYGLPNQVRSDLGSENVDVWRYMVEQHSSESVVVVGSSTHNERIERMWRDVHRCVGVLYADLFRTLERDGKLNCLNEVDMFCLHFIFIPRINRNIDSFVESWNNHPMSTAHNLTPNQQFIQGAVQQNMMPTLPVPIDCSRSCRIPTPHDAVVVPRSTFSPCLRLQQELDRMDILRPAEDFGYSVYVEVCEMVGHHILLCDEC